MKLFVLVLSLLVFACGNAQAGSSGCSNTSDLTWSQADPYDHLTASQCIVNATQADAGTTSLLTYLPTGPSDGDTFTLVDKTPTSYDTCENWYDDPSWGGDGNTYAGCAPAGFGFESTDSNVDGSTSDTLYEFYFTNCDVGDVTNGGADPSKIGSNPCTADQLPSYWSDYQSKRYSYTATYSTAAGGWVTTYAPAQ